MNWYLTIIGDLEYQFPITMPVLHDIPRLQLEFSTTIILGKINREFGCVDYIVN